MTTAAREKYETPKLTQLPAVEPVKCRCAVCKTEGIGFVARGPMGARWVNMPARWWVLWDRSDFHCRCPKCLDPKGAK
jgi:hypothetical protein